MRFPRRFPAAPPIAIGLLLLVGCGTDRSETLDSVYRVEVGQCLAVENQLATAVAVGPNLVVTVAHSLDGADSVTIEDRAGQTVQSELVYIDPTKDIALLELTGVSTTVLELAEPDSSGSVTIATAAGGDGPNVKPATIVDLVDATLDGEGKRAAIKLEADINPGDSGAAVVDAEGRMVGMVFATARGEDVGWAVAGGEIVAAVRQLEADGPTSTTLAC